mmetsp:Transcript_5026/g.11734  ORF Transcript_5026/g.11734 Transcript_5026/m.11734 type:complete len:216 (+) Transcript_5026:540-1187(+)
MLTLGALQIGGVPQDGLGFVDRRKARLPHRRIRGGLQERDLSRRLGSSQCGLLSHHQGLHLVIQEPTQHHEQDAADAGRAATSSPPSRHCPPSGSRRSSSPSLSTTQICKRPSTLGSLAVRSEWSMMSLSQPPCHSSTWVTLQASSAATSTASPVTPTRASTATASCCCASQATPFASLSKRSTPGASCTCSAASARACKKVCSTTTLRSGWSTS